MTKRPDWAKKFSTALNISEFTLFDIFKSPCRRVEIVSKFAGSLSMVLWRTYVKRGQCRM